ncbi:aminotransferase class I/II-fold pyridoxal phosphate-dependent enzyme [Cohnella caldifontis]|uniref:aminotransferase class I/II-fold pyridoxal phosphate-dependent enzyme n=1 Tax=Cohnella caldifontis TaxID=3027471 RepID=UPI0023EA8FC5|nr:PLP-dependent aminotransferase family protein [Cohnella sp. YIM B05605]
MNRIINWMGGWPRDGLVSASEWEERLAAAAERVRREDLSSGKVRTNLRDGLKTKLAHGLLKRKTQGKEKHLRIAMGADAVLTRIAEKSLQPGDTVLTERVTARSALQIFRKAGIRVEAVEGDGMGMDPDALRQAIRRFKPRLVYASPACSDPSGALWPEERADAAARICREAGVPLVRDDRQEMLRYEDAEGPELIRLAQVEPGVVSIGQLPPGLVAGLRFGWAVGQPDDLNRLLPTAAAALLEPGVTPLERFALSGLLQDHPLEPLVDMLRVQCRERMRCLTGLLLNHQALGLRWRNPEGGVHLWLKLPEGMDGEALLRGAWIKGLMFQPGAPFHADRPERNTLRLTFAYADEKQMKTGVSRLIDAMGEFMGRSDRG